MKECRDANIVVESNRREKINYKAR